MGGKVSAGSRLRGQRRHFKQRDNNTEQHARQSSRFPKATPARREEVLITSHLTATQSPLM